MDGDVVGHMAERKPKKPNGRKTLDIWFPTVVRYCGVVLLIYAAVVDQGKNPALIPTAAGLILFKTIVGNGTKDDDK